VSLPIGAAAIYWASFVSGVGPRTDQPGRLTLWFFVAFVIALIGYMATSELTSDGSIPELLGQMLSLGLSWWVANWFVYRGGVERLRGRVTG
jgi:lipopolysaccharide export LptBFGC system permease protein LptF